MSLQLTWFDLLFVPGLILVVVVQMNDLTEKIRIVSHAYFCFLFLGWSKSSKNTTYFIKSVTVLFTFQCVENVSRANCPVCLEDIHTSRTPCHIPVCAHLLHRNCFEQLLQNGHYACPICQTSLMDMTQLWKYLDSEVAITPMPPEYDNYMVDILCKDCHKVSLVATCVKTNTKSFKKRETSLVNTFGK